MIPEYIPGVNLFYFFEYRKNLFVCVKSSVPIHKGQDEKKIKLYRKIGATDGELVKKKRASISCYFFIHDI